MNVETPTLSTQARRLAVLVSKAGPGERSQLRRQDPETGCSAFWRMAAELGLGPHDLTWALVAQAFAELAGTDDSLSFESERPLGTALFQAGVSDARFRSITGALLEPRRARLLQACRTMRSKGVAPDLTQLAQLLIHKADRTLITVMSDYYQAEHVATAKKGKS